MARFYADPLGFVMYSYPWDTDPSIQLAEIPEPWASRYNCKYGPDRWACEQLDELGAEVAKRGFDGRNPVAPIRMADTSGHGIGKSAMTAWLVDWIMSTRPYAQGTVTANTSPQLETKTWAQIVKWTRKCITAHWFEITAGRGSMKMYHRDYPEAWFCSAQTCREENSEAFAGQHAANSTSFYIFDEASAVPDKIKEVAEGGLTDGEPMMFAFGNPTRATGWFRECFRRQRKRWICREIDSRDVQITNKTQIQEWVEDYGVDSDFVKVRVRGIFPSLSVRQFISSKDVDAAYGKHLRPEQYNFAPKIISADPAWQGDDEFVIGMRQGLRFQMLAGFPRNDDDVAAANLIAQLEDEHKADAVFIDMGYGTGIVSVGHTLGRSWQLVAFAEKPLNPGYLNKRAEMWGEAKLWLKQGGSIPEDSVLYHDLISPETVPRLDGKIQLESKNDMKKRGLPSPGRGDALALTFAYPVQARNRPYNPRTNKLLPTVQHEFDPFEDA